MRFAPYLLDPATPPEGKPRKQMTQPGAPKTNLEERGELLGITFTRGRQLTSNSHLALQAQEFAAERGEDGFHFHRRMFKAYFEELADIGDIETLVRLGEEAGLPAAELREALATGVYREQVDDGIRWAYEIGITGVPTFIFDEQYGVVGAQDQAVFEAVMEKLGNKRR